jgi:Competence protein CoiA-like family
MTLTAIDKEFMLYFPAKQLADGSDRAQIEIDVRTAQKDVGGFFCPHCYRKSGEFLPVHFNKGHDLRRPSFSHQRDNVMACQNSTGETEKHLVAKFAIAERLRAIEGVIDMKIDTLKLMSNSPNVQDRKPDIWVIYANSATQAHEIQISPIDSAQLAARTADMKALGVTQVIWYLYGKNYNAENRLWLNQNGIDCYRLWFEDGDNGEEDDSLPRWELTYYQEPKKRSAAKGILDRDLCSTSVQVASKSSPQSEQPKPRGRNGAFMVGDKVTGHPDWGSAIGWHGVVKSREKEPDLPTGFYYRVYWDERASHPDKRVAAKPILGMRADQMMLISAKEWEIPA